MSIKGELSEEDRHKADEHIARTALDAQEMHATHEDVKEADIKNVIHAAKFERIANLHLHNVSKARARPGNAIRKGKIFQTQASGVGSNTCPRPSMGRRGSP